MVELLALFVAAALLAFPILALIAFVRSREVSSLRERIGLLEDAVSRLQSAVRAPRPVEPPPAAPAPAPAPAPVFVPPPTLPALERRPAPPAPPPPLPPPPSPAPASLAPPKEPAFQIDWERWIGIRGAALAGAVVLALAALLFFQYSIQHGLITPAMRVVLGIVVGLGCLVGSELLRPRGYGTTAEGVAGAGIVCLYAAFWAAHTLYGLVGLGLTFLLMLLVTATCCLASIRHASQTIAVLGLVGGFATPLLLRSEADRPIGLFGYVLLLDLGLLAIGKKKGWPVLAVLSLGGTLLLQGLWIGFRVTPGRLALALVILALFAVVFAIVGQSNKTERSTSWFVSQAGAVLFPFTFAAYFAARVDLGAHLWPLALLLALLAAASSWVGRANVAPWLPTGAAVGSVTVVAVWALKRTLTTGLAWEMSGVAVALALVFQAFVELEPVRARAWKDRGAGAVLATCGFLMVSVLVSAASSAAVVWPWLAGWLALSALLYRQAAWPDCAPLQIGAGVAVAIGLSFAHIRHAAAPGFPRLTLFLGALVAVAVLAQAAVFLRERGPLRYLAEHAGAAVAVISILGFAPSPLSEAPHPGKMLACLFALSILAILAATRLASGAWYAAAAAATALLHWNVAYQQIRLGAPHAGITLVFLAGAVVLFTLWPFVERGAAAGERATLCAAALAGPIWFWPMKTLFVACFGSAFVGVLPIALALLSLGAVVGARGLWASSDPRRLRGLVWFSAVAISFVSVAIPLQLEKEWITIGWALEGVALTLLWRRLDHPGLKWFAIGALAAASARLVVNPALLLYYPRSGVPIFNWILYTYLVPAAALLVSAGLLRPLEVARIRPAERVVYTKDAPLAATFLGFCAIAVVFVWINLAIADWFTEGPALTLRFGRSAARDLTVSIAWAAYALVLLLIGMFRDSVGLRWLSLASLVATIGKVFLYDLGELRDLYRVASLVGLAVSLILVSLLYQRFVFRKGEAG